MIAPSDELPLVDTSQADEFFSPQGDADSDAMQREIWSDLTADLIPKLQATLANAREADSLRTELHRIRGYCATCALARLADFLHKWEHLPDPVAATRSLAPEALALARRSLLQIDLLYPHLNPPTT